MTTGFATTVTAASGLACLIVAFALWRRRRGSHGRALVIFALGTTAVHLLATAPGVLDTRAVWLVAALRSLAWLAVLRALLAADGRHASLKPVRPMLAALILVELLQVPLVILSEIFDTPEAFDLIARVSGIFQLLFAIGMLVLVHNFHVGAGPEQRSRIGWISGALVLGWGFEMNASALVYVAGSMPDLMTLARAVTWSIVAALVWLDGRKASARTFSPSRTVAFQGLSVLVIALYLFALFTIDSALSRSDVQVGTVSRFAGILLAALVGALFASGSARAWLREVVVRNFFRHRYDYREEWLRLSRTIAGSTADTGSVEQRAIQALAEIVDSPAGLLLTPDEGGPMTLSARWAWPSLEVPSAALPMVSLSLFERGEAIVTLDDLRDDNRGLRRALVPEWLLANRTIWALVPLQVDRRLIGVAVLARPAYARRLDWEDFDLLRIVGQQLAAHLAENQAQKALLDAARFDEFNRRMAFVLHDIKNLASQLGLVVSNAERHIENPAFRADMLVTLRSATDRMEALLGRLSHYGGQGVGAKADIAPLDLVRRALAVEIASGLVAIAPGEEEALRCDADALEQVVRHLARNAIEASQPGEAVRVAFVRNRDRAGIEIVDHGCGMSAEFVRTTLFKPFVSTKASGFGIGAFEAREMVRAMGGRLEVESREGFGSRFAIWLPRAADANGQAGPEDDRKVA